MIREVVVSFHNVCVVTLVNFSEVFCQSINELFGLANILFATDCVSEKINNLV